MWKSLAVDTLIAASLICISWKSKCFNHTVIALQNSMACDSRVSRGMHSHAELATCDSWGVAPHLHAAATKARSTIMQHKVTLPACNLNITSLRVVIPICMRQSLMMSPMVGTFRVSPGSGIDASVTQPLTYCCESHQQNERTSLGCYTLVHLAQARSSQRCAACILNVHQWYQSGHDCRLPHTPRQTS